MITRRGFDTSSTVILILPMMLESSRTVLYLRRPSVTFEGLVKPYCKDNFRTTQMPWLPPILPNITDCGSRICHPLLSLRSLLFLRLLSKSFQNFFVFLFVYIDSLRLAAFLINNLNDEIEKKNVFAVCSDGSIDHVNYLLARVYIHSLK